MNEQKTQRQAFKGEKEYKKGFFPNLFRWNIDEKELKYQVDNYDTLGLFRSAKGVATALLALSAIILIILVLPSKAFALLDIMILLVLALFINKGSSLALIIAMIYWSFDKIIGVFDDIILMVQGSPDALFSLWITVIIWVIWMKVFWRAYQVEKEKNKIKNIPVEEGKYFYCRQCGEKISQGDIFCPKCGAKIK
jgi:hypothetical protein